MSGSVNDLVRDATSLYRFIASIAKRQEPEKNHRKATEDFLRYINHLSENAQRYLQIFVERADSALAEFERQGLSTIREFWSDLHEFVRPVEDAHSLNIPVALIELLENRLSQLEGLDGSRLVLSHTAEWNYTEYPRSDLRFHAQTYEGVVGGGPPFPQKMAFIEMPYSQGNSLFLNLVICHEIGHFVFEELNLEQELSSHIEAVLQGTLEGYGSMSEPDLSWCRERLKYWSEEIYCDRFAIGLVGPAFCFAYIELFDVIGTSDTDETGLAEFSDTHPSDACRFKEYADQLRKGNWWDLLDQDAATSYVALIKKLEAVPEEHYLFSSDEKRDHAMPVLAAFLKLKPAIGDLVNKTFKTKLRVFRGATDREQITIVKNYLSHGVVPSTLMQNGKESHPDAIALINAAYLFYLESLSQLMHRIEGQKDAVLADRHKWAERVEMWTLKSLEDLRLISSSMELTNGDTVPKGY